MLEQLIARWSGLTKRDRRMVVFAGIFLLLVFGWLVAFEPAWKGRQALERELPVLRSDLAQMDQLALEARTASRNAQESTDSAAQLRGRIEQSLEEAGLTPSLAQLELSGELIEARFRQADYEKWLFWLDGALRDTRMRVVDLSLTRESAGVVSGRLALEAPRRGQ